MRLQKKNRSRLLGSNIESAVKEVSQEVSIELLEQGIQAHRQTPELVDDRNYFNRLHGVGDYLCKPAQAWLNACSKRLPRNCCGRSSTAWKAVVILNIFISLLVLAINFSVPVWAAGRFQKYVLYRGSCGKVKTAALITHAAINVLGSTVLAASNYAMQVLSSPSRKDIDRAHQQRQPFSIGVLSLGNLKIVGKYRTALWLALAISSIPFHLIYNAMVFSVSGLYAYKIAVVSPKFLDGASFELNMINDITSSSSTLPFPKGLRSYDGLPSEASSKIPAVNLEDQLLLETLQKSLQETLQTKAKGNKLIGMDKKKCIKTYFEEKQTHFRNLIVVSGEIESNSSVVWLEYSDPTVDPTSSTLPTSWMCRFQRTFETGQVPDTDRDCSSEFQQDEAPENWSIGLYGSENNGRWRFGSYRISRCFAEDPGPSCRLKYDVRLLALVIAANVVKVLAMVATSLQYKQPALVTLGDALASFLRRPDKTTRGMCLATSKDFALPAWERGSRTYLEEDGRASRFSGASRQQWTLSASTFTITMVFGLSFFAVIYQTPTPFHWSSGVVQKSSIKIGFGLDDASLVVLSNLPQVVLSFNYLVLNRLVSCMALSREWSLFAHRRKGLRTSNPEGAQRSTYWLNLPFRFGLPMILSSAGLHYLASQSLFYGSIRTYSPYDDDTGFPDTIENYTGLGYSQDAAQILLIALLLFNSIIIMYGRSQNKVGIPQGVLNSAVISAACHPPPEDEDAHLKPVKWGEVEGGGESSDVAHCSFSSGTVVAPTQGRKYM